MNDPNSLKPARGNSLSRAYAESPKTTRMGGLDNNIAAVAAYAPLFPLNLIACGVWLYYEPRNNRFLRFASMQAIALAASYVAIWLAASVIGIMPVIGPILYMLLLWVSGLVYVVASIYLLLQAYKGEVISLPIIGPFIESNT
jgi:uncharacterized membrane protein